MKKIILIILMLAAISFLTTFFIKKDTLVSTKKPEEGIVFFVKKGEGFKEISSNLKKQGLIKSELAFKFSVIFSGVQNKLKAGDYLLSPEMDIREIINKIVFGDTIKITITFPEGLTQKAIAEKLKE